MRKTIVTAFLALCCGGYAVALSPNDNLRFVKNIYSVDRARDIGDLLTITISENATSKKSEDLDTTKTAHAKGSVDGAFGSTMSGATNPFQSFSNNIKRTANNNNLPISNYEFSGTSTFSGKGSANSQDALTMNLTVRVVDKLENGVLVIRGDRRIVIRNESVNMVVTGLVRMRDISSDNVISSERVADAHIIYETAGEVSRGSRPGYFWRAFQWLNPL